MDARELLRSNLGGQGDKINRENWLPAWATTTSDG